MQNTTIQLEPQVRIDKAGGDLRVSVHEAQYRICLVRKADNTVVACASAGRTGKLTLPEVLDRIRRGTWAPSSSVYRAVALLADVADKELQ